jgi:hypothetical protein
MDWDISHFARSMSWPASGLVDDAMKAISDPASYFILGLIFGYWL